MIKYIVVFFMLVSEVHASWYILNRNPISCEELDEVYEDVDDDDDFEEMLKEADMTCKITRAEKYERVDFNCASSDGLREYTLFDGEDNCKKFMFHK